MMRSEKEAKLSVGEHMLVKGKRHQNIREDPSTSNLYSRTGVISYYAKKKKTLFSKNFGAILVEYDVLEQYYM